MPTQILESPQLTEKLSRRAEKLREAQSAWARLSVLERLRPFSRLRALLSQQAEDIVQVISSENGKTSLESLSQEVIPVLDTLHFLETQAADILRAKRIPLKTKQFYFRGKENWMVYEPFGVVGILGTWNYPFILSMAQILFSLAAGNSVMFKGAPDSERVTIAIQKLFTQAGFPPHVLYCFTSGVEGGQALTELKLDKYLLTGSRATGRAVMGTLARHLKPSVMELSGCDPYVIMSDANWSLALQTLFWAAFQYSGQTCVAPRRIFILRQDHDKFFRLLKREWSRQTEFLNRTGLLRSPELARSEKAKLAQLTAKGARLEFGEDISNSDTAYFPPQIYSGLSAADLADMDFMAPVCFVIEVEDESEVLREVNSSRFALGASLWTTNAARARSWAPQIRAGQVWVNDSIFSVALGEVPFGGLRDSGFGKTRGREGLLEMVEARFVSYDWRKSRTRVHLPPYDRKSFAYLNQIQRMLYDRTWSGKWAAICKLMQISMKK